MKIRTQFIINMIVLGSILLFVSVAVVVTNQWVENTHGQQELAAQVEHEAYELGYLANDYLLYRESHQASRWESQFASFSDHLSKMQVNTPEQQALVASIRSNQQRLKAVFEEVKARIETAPQTPESGFDRKFMQLSWSRLETQNQGMIFDASRLEGLLNEQEHRLEQFARLLIFVLIGMLGVFLLVNYGLTFRRMLRAIASLQAGTRIIGLGNLDFAIDVKNEDEIGELSHAFNRMTQQLKTITASRAELEREITERKQAEEILHRFELLSNHSRDIILFMRREDGHILEANDAAIRDYGYSHDELLSLSIRDLRAPNTLGLTAEQMAQADAGGILFETVHRRKDGSTFPVEVSSRGATIGGVRTLISIVRDITERKQAEDRFNKAFHASPTALVISRQEDGRIETINDTFIKLFGYTEEEVVGKTSTELGMFANPVDRQEAIQKLRNNGFVRNFELDVRLKSGEVRTASLSIEKMNFERVDAMLTMIQDITERKQAEEEILNLSKFPAENPYPILRVQNDGRVTYANAASQELLEVWGCEINGYLPEELKNLIGVIVDHASNKTLDIACNDKVYSITLVPIAEGGYVNLYGSDITARKRAEGHVQKLNQELSHHATELEFANEELGIIGEKLRVANEDLQKEIAEHKRAEEALRISEEKYRLIADHANDWIYWIKPDGSFQYISPSCERVTGFTPLDFNKDPHLFTEILHPEDRGRIETHLKEIIEGGETHDLDYRILTKTKEVRWISHSCEPVYAVDGQYLGRSGTNRDITERKQVEEVLLVSEARYRHTLDDMLEGCQIIGHDWKYLYLNDVADKHNRRPKEDLLGRKYMEMWPGIESTYVFAVIQQCMKERRSQSIENEFTFPDGREGCFELRIFPVPEGIAILSIDITERKQAERQLRYQAAILSNVNDAIIASDAQFRLTAWNSAAESLYGWKAEEVIGRNGLEIVRTEWPERDADEMRHTISETGRWRGEAAQMRKDGTRFPVEVSSIVLYDNSGQIAGYISVNHDITERKRAEEELHRLLEELKVSNTELEQFAYVASHDLQEPLRMVSSYMQLLARRYQGKLDSDADEFIAFAVDGAKRMQNLINDLLVYSRVGTRGRTLVASSCEGALKEALANLQFAIEESGATITHEPLPEVKGDPTQLVQLFQNLLSNAIKFRGPEPPRIHVDVHQESAEWVFRVCDNGIGLDSKFAERIFVIFQRLHHRDSYPGTGIGLAICKRIVQRHGGRIWVESQPGEGATFYFTLPIKENT